MQLEQIKKQLGGGSWILLFPFIAAYKIKPGFQNLYYFDAAAADTAAKSLQSCLALCDPIDSSPLGCSVPGILQARTLE